MTEDVFTVRLYCLDRDIWISEPVEAPIAYKKKPSLLSLYYTKTDILFLKPQWDSGGIATAWIKNGFPFWFQRLPHDIYQEDIIRISCQEGQMVFDDVA